METPSGATTETTTTATAAGSENPGAESPPAAKGPGENERIDELTSNWRNEQRNTEHYRTRTAELERELAALRGNGSRSESNQVDSADDDDEPIKTLADFKYDESLYGKYIRDLARTESRRETERLRGEIKGERTKADRQAAVSEFSEKAVTWAKGQKLDNVEQMFKSPAEGGPAISETMAEVITTSEHGPEVLHYLSKNVAESRRIHALSPVLQAREIGRLEAKFASAPTPNAASGAPPPHPTVKGASDTSTKADPAKQTDSEWWASKQRSDRARQSARK